MKKIVLPPALVLLGILFGPSSSAQYNNNNVVNYEEIADLPYGINRMWLHFQPMVADMFFTNLAFTTGIQANVYATDKLEFAGALRFAPFEGFDMNRWAARNAKVNVENEEGQAFLFENEFATHTYFEFTGNYHIKDFEQKGLSKIMLTSKKSKVLEFTNLQRIDVNSTVRKIMGARGGMFHYTLVANLHSAFTKQGTTLIDGEGQKRDFDVEDKIYTNLAVTGIILGANYGTIRNISVDADKYGPIANNTMFNSYFDLMLALPSTMQLDDVVLDIPDNPAQERYSTEDVNMLPIGFRAGFDIMYNQDIFYAFGGEMGMRPGIAGQGWYALAKLSLPAMSFKFKQARTANNTGALKKR